jgi:oxygen-independent coproporphyrinogen III oxidase
VDTAPGVYVHVPFCSAICHYCNFSRGLLDESLTRRYVDAVVTELRRSPAGLVTDTLYFGGGTPSLLPPAEVGRLVQACRDALGLVDEAEVTLEVNPEDADAARLEGFRAAGITRLSFGVQSFRDEELARLGRLHDADGARRALAHARVAGFDNVSLDLMMWLPGQTTPQYLESVDALIDLGPEHASLYLLEIYPNAPLRDEMARGGWHVAPDDEAATMYLDGLARLDRAGYLQYEISNVARPGRESRHNLKYWTDGEWLAFGSAAHGTFRGERWRNVATAGDYVARIEAGQAAAVERRTPAAVERLGDALFMGLRLTEGVDVAALGARYGTNVWGVYGAALVPFVESGHLVREGSRLRLTREGMLLSNEVLAAFV